MFPPLYGPHLLPGKRAGALDAPIAVGAHGCERVCPLLRYLQPLNGSAGNRNTVALASLADDHLQAALGFALVTAEGTDVAAEVGGYHQACR